MIPIARSSMRHSVATRVLLVVLSLYMVIVTVVTLGHVWADYHYQATTIAQDMHAFERAYGTALALGLWELDEAALTATVEGMLSTPPLVGMTLKGAEGQTVAVGGVVVSQGETGQVGVHVKLAGCSEHDRTVHPREAGRFAMFEHHFEVIYELDGERLRLGEATIYSNSSMIFRRMKMQLVMLAVDVLVTLLTFSVALLVTMHHYLRKPLRVLTDATSQISLDNLGSFSVDSSVFHLDEIKVLEEALTDMAGNLHRSFQYREAADLELRQLRNNLSSIIDSMPSILVGVDPEGRVTQWNRAAERATALSSIDAIGQLLSKAFPRLTEELPRVHEAMDSQQVRRDVNRLVEREGEAVYEDLTVYPLVANGVRGAVIRLDDVTERVCRESQEKLLLRRLSALERRQSLGILAGGVAHDLNNIMGPLVMLPDLIDEVLESAHTASDAEIAEARHDLSMVLDSAQRAAKVIKGLQSLGQRGNVEMSALDVTALVSGCLVTHDIEALRSANDELTIESELHRGRLTIRGNSTDLHRVLMNLIVNAADAISAQGRIQVTTAPVTLATERLGYELIPPGDYVVLQVRDTGAGISDELWNGIFEPFVSSKRKASGSASGSGLGLSVVHAIMKDHNGAVDVTRACGGWSTSFSLYFPAVGGAGATGEMEVRDYADGGGGTERVLVVDDMPSQRAIARRGLERVGYRVDEATDGRAAVACFEESDPAGAAIDLVLLDMIMEPGFDGLDTLRAIRERKPDQKVIVVSGHAPAGRGEAALQLGAGWLNKPYQIANLLALVRRTLDEE
jgi:PAS domain S-box-containing protein